MKCSMLESYLDKYMDDELTADEARELDEHVESCEACAREYAATVRLKKLMGEMAPELDVPLETQAQWRSAVRAEASKQRRKHWYRYAGAVAAAMVVMLGVGLMLRPGVKNMDSGVSLNPSSVQVKGDNEADASMYDADAASMENATAAGLARVETDGVELFEAEEAADEPMEETAVADAVPMRELTLSVDRIDDACGYILDLVAEYEGTVDEQRFAEDDGNGVNLFIEIPAENAPEFLSSAAHYGNVSADSESMDLPAEGMLSLLLVIHEE